MPKSPVIVSLQDLQTGSIPLSQLEDAFGPSSLGILIVKDFPSQFLDLRSRVLSYSSYLGNLAPSELARLEVPEASFLVGWSLGKETLASGRYDTLKGSYYINCAFYKDASLAGPPYASDYPDFPQYTAPNVWPHEAVLTGFQEAVTDLIRLIIDTAVLVGRQCDRFGLENIEGYVEGTVEKIVRESLVSKARLLHYFPSAGNADEARNNDDWCATHKDHGVLTGLTSAMFVDETSNPPRQPCAGLEPPVLPELPVSPDPNSGLFIQDRTGATIKVAIPRDCLAFQTGEALESITGGKFKAVPHFVRGLGSADERQIARNTLAVFTQPNLWEVVDKERRLDFAGFSKEVVERNL